MLHDEERAIDRSDFAYLAFDEPLPAIMPVRERRHYPSTWEGEDQRKNPDPPDLHRFADDGGPADD